MPSDDAETVRLQHAQHLHAHRGGEHRARARRGGAGIRARLRAAGRAIAPQSGPRQPLDNPRRASRAARALNTTMAERRARRARPARGSMRRPAGARSGATDTLTTPEQQDRHDAESAVHDDGRDRRARIGTRSAESAYARTRSPPTLAGRNVPTNVLTKKMRMTRPSGGRRVGRDGREQRQPAPRHQGAIEERQADGDQQGNRARGRGDAPDLSGVADPEQP